MLKTERISHINEIPSSGFIKCPSCGALASVDDERCSHCGEIVDYRRNRERLLKWNLDLINFQMEEIKDGMVCYRSKYVGDNYRNCYSLDKGANIISDEYSSFDLRYYRYYPNSPGIFVISLWRQGIKQQGILDKNGEVIVSPVCDYIDYIEPRGIFIVKYKGKTGIITLSNENVVPIEYDSIKRATSFDKDYFVVEKSGKFGMVDYRNRMIVPIEFDGVGGYKGGPIPVCQDGKWGFFDPDSNSVIIPFKYDIAEPFKGACAKVRLGDTELYIDKGGYPSLPEHYGEKEVIENGRVVIKDEKGFHINKPIFDPVERRHTVWPYKVEDKEGAINSDGYFVIPPEYDDLFIENSGLCSAKIGERWGIISTDGKIVLPFEYLDALVCEGIIRIHGVSKTSGKWKLYGYGFVNRYGETIFPIQFTDASVFHEGLCWYERNIGKSYGIMDKFGNYVEYSAVVENGNYVKV